MWTPEDGLQKKQIMCRSDCKSVYYFEVVIGVELPVYINFMDGEKAFDREAADRTPQSRADREASSTAYAPLGESKSSSGMQWIRSA